MGQLFDNVGYSNPNFTLDVSKWDTTNVTNMEAMFRAAGYNSTKMNTSFTIRNTGLASYWTKTNEVFKNFCIKPGTKMVVNYTSETSSLVDTMVATKTSGANVVKGNLVS
jgi:surface protein